MKMMMEKMLLSCPMAPCQTTNTVVRSSCRRGGLADPLAARDGAHPRPEHGQGRPALRRSSRPLDECWRALRLLADVDTRDDSDDESRVKVLHGTIILVRQDFGSCREPMSRSPTARGYCRARITSSPRATPSLWRRRNGNGRRPAHEQAIHAVHA